MKSVLALAAVAEAATGAILIAYPSIVVRLLFGSEIAGAGILVSRIAGASLIGLGLACWPNGSASLPVYGMLTYGTLAMLYNMSRRYFPRAACRTRQTPQGTGGPAGFARFSVGHRHRQN